ncbi:MAG TPA: amino acid adenylation domain-containing protein, partial [Mycobacteriales bacterium]|nr:amino acid adenylation domain-containing protein [Mycobacteriales bacterium]
FAGDSLSYAALNRRANRLAHHLRGLGVGPDVLVAIAAERSLDLHVGLLGVLKAGGAYVPLDPSYPPERLAFMLADCRAPVLITQSHLRASLPPFAGTVLCLDALDAVLADEPESDPVPVNDPDDLAYVIYTSGSTGQPKGVMVSHRGVSNTLLGLRDAYAVTPADCLLYKASFSFDVSVWEMFLGLLVGARVVVARPGGEADPAYLAELIQRERVSIIHFIPSLLPYFLDEPASAGCTSLRTLMAGGDVLPPDIPPRVHVRFDLELWNGYGPTEASIASSQQRVERGWSGASVPIGPPFPNVRYYVLDGYQQPVPVGVPGELFIGGMSVARGYLHRPDLTAARFLPDPFSPEPGARLYRTGDLVRYRPDGALEFLGRLDDQVKLRGFRIELGEVEAVLGRAPGVGQAVVLLREDRPGDRRLVAYVVPAAGATLSPDELRRHAGQFLPDYMVPAAFVILTDFPKMPSGKLDRQALPLPEAPAPLEAYLAPRTPAEQTLAAIWVDVLGLDRVGVHDNFFEIGGHSLFATQVASRIRAALAIEVPLRLLFQAPTVARLAEEIDRLETAGDADMTSIDGPLPRASREAELPLSFGQQQLWILDRIDPGNVTYSIPIVARLRGALDPSALERSLNAVVARHESLRTSFPAVDGRPRQAIAPELRLALPVVDLRGLPAAELEAEAHRRLQADIAASFDLQRGPLLRALLLQLADDEHLVLLDVHHIVSDGWSTGVLLRELAALYAAFTTDQPASLPDLPIQYADYAAWQRARLAAGDYADQLAYWRAQLADLPAALDLPTDHPRPAVRSGRGARLPISLPPALVERLTALCQAEGVTLFMALTAAFQTLLHRYTGQDDVVVGTPIANRRRRDLEDLVGFFVNTLVLRTDLSGNPTLRQLLRRVREVTLGAYAHQELPFQTLVETLAPRRDLSLTPLFQVMLVLQNAPLPALALPGLALQPV